MNFFRKKEHYQDPTFSSRAFDVLQPSAESVTEAATRRGWGLSPTDTFQRMSADASLKRIEYSMQNNKYISPQSMQYFLDNSEFDQFEMLDITEANNLYGSDTLKFDEPISNVRAAETRRRHDAFKKQDYILAKATGGRFFKGMFIEMGMAMIDPFNLALIPVTGANLVTKNIRRMEDGAKKFGIIGAAGGFAATSVTEPWIYAQAQAEQLDYNMYHSLINVGAGTILSGGLGSIAGAITRAYKPTPYKELETEIKNSKNIDEETANQHKKIEIAETEAGRDPGPVHNIMDEIKELESKIILEEDFVKIRDTLEAQKDVKRKLKKLEGDEKALNAKMEAMEDISGSESLIKKLELIERRKVKLNKEIKLLDESMKKMGNIQKNMDAFEIFVKLREGVTVTKGKDKYRVRAHYKDFEKDNLGDFTEESLGKFAAIADEQKQKLESLLREIGYDELTIRDILKLTRKKLVTEADKRKFVEILRSAQVQKLQPQIQQKLKELRQRLQDGKVDEVDTDIDGTVIVDKDKGPEMKEAIDESNADYKASTDVLLTKINKADADRIKENRDAELEKINDEMILGKDDKADTEMIDDIANCITKSKS
tara:strand:- start:2450 stop:4246 length:1797 start_codon:yes stop_codon:yes gene_type:complete